MKMQNPITLGKIRRVLTIIRIVATVAFITLLLFVRTDLAVLINIVILMPFVLVSFHVEFFDKFLPTNLNVPFIVHIFLAAIGVTIFFIFALPAFTVEYKKDIIWLILGGLSAALGYLHEKTLRVIDRHVAKITAPN